MIINKTQIAILLGVYNAEPYIKEQIESILSQSLNNWTLYIRDDASTDNTLQIINEFAFKNKNIVVLADKDGNLGCNGNYFRLLEMVESQYYMFCNADDYWYPFKIELSFKRMKYEEESDKSRPIIIHTDLTITDRNLNVLVESFWTSVNINPEKYKTYNRLGACSIVAGATMLFNTPVKKLTFPVSDSAPFFDYWIALKVVKEDGVIASIHKSTIAYRQIGTNLAGVTIGNENKIYYKIKNIKNVLKFNIEKAKMLKSIGWGDYLKYIYYKVIVSFIIRFSHKYDKEKEMYKNGVKGERL
ncbi:MAG: glycosyltransferase [Kiritimatiellae bacterium]|nr:glycosyltransferase [Kiritimatiellia bacterium]